jgi:hypothetical protein
MKPKPKAGRKRKHKAQLLGDELHNLTLKLGNIVIASGYPRTDVLFRLRILPWPKGGHPFFDTKKKTRKKETDIPQKLPIVPGHSSVSSAPPPPPPPYTSPGAAATRSHSMTCRHVANL